MRRLRLVGIIPPVSRFRPWSWRRPPQEPLCNAILRNPQIITVFEGEPSGFLGMPIVPWDARQAALNVSSQKTILRIQTREIRYLIFTCKYLQVCLTSGSRTALWYKQDHKELVA